MYPKTNLYESINFYQLMFYFIFMLSISFDLNVCGYLANICMICCLIQDPRGES